MAKTLVALILCLSFAATVSAAAPPQPKTTASPQAKPAKPDWSELKPAQQQVLAPLQEEWKVLDTLRRKKWVKVADAYPKMKPAEQVRLQTRMKDWAKLTPEQRRVAREKYQSIKKLPPEKREQIKAQWQQYQQSLAVKPETSGEAASDGSAP
jgi:Protein of unknown function (DUF3106)